MKSMIKPTEAELEILQILWQNGASTVRFVNEKLNDKREVGYTTTLKMMQLMFEKGMLRRDDSERTHIYTSVYGEEAIQKTLVDKLLETAFGGSAMKLVMQALGNKNTSKDELAQIKDLLNQIEKGGKQ
jgi:BlaI family transcriptional regulator, penicillinase repressor